MSETPPVTSPDPVNTQAPPPVDPATKPRVGRNVVTKGCAHANGTFEHPGIVTRVWSDACVNVKVLPDCGELVDATSVAFFATRAAADEYLGNNAANPQPRAAFYEE